MSGENRDFEHLFDELRLVAQTPVLAEPADIRWTGTHRITVRRIAVALSVTLALIVGGLTAYGSGVFMSAPVGTDPSRVAASPTAEATPTGSASPTTQPTTDPTNQVSPNSSTSSGSSGLPARTAGADCRPRDLDPRPYYATEGAMGTAYHTITVQNVSSTRCRLYGHPTVLFTDPATGHTATLPTQRRDTATPVMLAPGGWATVYISTVNGNPYGPGAPECAHPHSYQGLSLVIGDELPYRLPSFTLSWECDQASIGAWQPAPDGPATNATRAGSS